MFWPGASPDGALALSSWTDPGVHSQQLGVDVGCGSRVHTFFCYLQLATARPIQKG